MDPGSLSSVCVGNWWNPPTAPSFFAAGCLGMNGAALARVPCLSAIVLYLTVGLEAMGPTYHGLKLPKLRKTELALVTVMDE